MFNISQQRDTAAKGGIIVMGCVKKPYAEDSSSGNSHVLCVVKTS